MSGRLANLEYLEFQASRVSDDVVVGQARPGFVKRSSNLDLSQASPWAGKFELGSGVGQP